MTTEIQLHDRYGKPIDRRVSTLTAEQKAEALRAVIAARHAVYEAFALLFQLSGGNPGEAGAKLLDEAYDSIVGASIEIAGEADVRKDTVWAALGKNPEFLEGYKAFHAKYTADVRAKIEDYKPV
ncbi:hypothetical protein AX768_13460 [Burkholderia sp. PAMC 28687]|uniref:hypothetical protein n=1 Tax=Burkholderia sp. PAMC 28687 TaxID=1795874 RepID=UPI000784CD19|nr:hypothetical protein [Burkholderia sp. PAMC 28687]AMM14954.1 hypothetical protein AX768_13460 [Burkholderia sp. PAMC 28687]